MPWLATPKFFNTVSRHPAATEVQPATVKWCSENPWFYSSHVVMQAAVTAMDDLLDEFPGLPLEQLLGRVITRMRVLHPGLVPDLGFLGGPGGTYWVGAAPEVSVTKLACERTCLRRLPDFGEPGDWISDLTWYLPAGPIGLAPPHIIGPVLLALEAGRSVCLAGASADIVDGAAEFIRGLAASTAAIAASGRIY